MTDFKQKVFAVVRKIPAGKVMTYKEVAAKAGHPNASRAVGGILATNFDPNIPCHRVIRSDGGMGGYNRGIENKLNILKKEGAIKDIRKAK
jgi:O-6-methylguanine DNA methyltransferase